MSNSCFARAPQRLHHSPVSVNRANEDCGFWDLQGIAMVRSAVPQSQQSVLCASALQENGYKQHFPVPGKCVKNRNNKGLKLFENCIGTV